MDTLFTLNNIKPGQTVKINRLNVKGDMRRRLLDIGLTEGSCVQCVLRPFNGDPIAYLIRGAIIALRRDDTENILVSPATDMCYKH